MTNKIYDSLDPIQLEAVKHDTGPLLVVAGPGSGKTRFLTHRVAHLIYTAKARPDNVLATTFTNKAAEEMRARLLELLGWPAKKIRIGTVHGTCARLLRDCGPQKAGLSANYTIYDPSKAGSVLSRVIKELRPKLVKEAQTVDDRIALEEMSAATVQELITEAKEKGFHPNEFGKMHREGRLIEPFYQEYNLRLRESNAADFGDLQLLTLDMLRTHADVRQLVQEHFQWVLVDEYQDTNDVQAELFKLIAGGTGNLTAVGDLDQSIYSFRYADPSNIRHFEQDWPGTKVIFMGTNYRSTPNIVQSAAAVIANNSNRFTLEFRTVRPEGAPPKIVRCRTEEEAALLAAQIVLAHYSQDQIPLSEMAVLYRFNKASRSLESAFRLRGIPYNVVGGIPFYERREIADLLAWLAVLANPLDAEAFARASRVPPRGVGETTIDILRKFAEDRKISIVEAARQITGLRAKQAEGLRVFLSLWDSFRERADDPALLSRIVEEIGYVKFLQSEEDDIENRLLNIQELITTYSTFCQQIITLRDTGAVIPPEGNDVPIDVVRFQRMIELEDDPSRKRRPTAVEMFMENVMLQKTEREDLSQDKVHLSSIHAAKGTEFTVVVVVGCEQGTLPSFRSLADAEALEEERRVFYVAMTRAKDHLYLLHSRQGSIFGRRGLTPVEMEPSIFLFEALSGGAVEAKQTDLPQPRAFGPIKIVSKGKVF